MFCKLSYLDIRDSKYNKLCIRIYSNGNSNFNSTLCFKYKNKGLINWFAETKRNNEVMILV